MHLSGSRSITTPVLFQHHNYGFSVPVVFRNKAQCAGNGRTLAKHCTKSRRPEATQLTAEHHRSALRVSLSRPTDCVSPLAKGMAITCEARLAVNLDKLTELAIIILKEHL